MNIKDILNQIADSDEAKAESKRILTEIQKGPSGFSTTELLITILSLRAEGVPQEQIAVIGMLIINSLMKINGISEDEMMMYIRKFK